VKKPKISTRRLALMFVLVTLGWCAIMARFAQIQILEGARYDELVVRQCWGEFELSAKRGAIYDCNENLLAFDIPSESFYTYAATRRYLREIGRRIGNLTGDPAITKRIIGRPGEFNWLVRRADPVLADKIKSLDMDSVRSHSEFKRTYPYGSLGMDLIGQVDADHSGISCLEIAYNELLKPTPGIATFQRDGRGKVYRISDAPLVRPRPGADLKLTLDYEYQQILEEELKKAVCKWNAKSGTAVFVEVSTGRILAADCYSPVDENAGYERIFKTRIVTDLFEPGSTFKLVAFAGMIEENLFSLTDTIWAGMGKFKFNGRTMHDDKELGTITFRRAFELSSNIATGRFSQTLSGKRLFKYARLFGFGQPTGTDLPGEQRGRLAKPRRWNEFWTAQISIGHGLSVNTLQLAGAFAAIANDGVLMRPYLVEEIRNESGRVEEKFQPRAIRRVVSKETAATMRDLMAGVVDSGTAQVARIEDVPFSGKTGTAQKPDLENGGYFWDKYIAGFGGFFPRDNPRIAGVVIIDEPQRVHYGGYTAAPVLAEFARRTTLLEKTRKNWAEENSKADAADKRVTVDNDDKSIDNPEEESRSMASSMSHQESLAWLSKPSETSSSPCSQQLQKCRDQMRSGILPDMKGLSARDVVILLHDLDCRISVSGSGRIESQVPSAGCRIADVEAVSLVCGSNSGG